MDFDLLITHSQVAVFLSSLERPFNYWSDAHVRQGFAWRAGSVSFRTVDEGGPHRMQVEVLAAAPPDHDTVARIIAVPFEVPTGERVEVASVVESVTTDVPAGTYELRFENAGRSSREQAVVRLLFQRTQAPSFRILRHDAEISPSSVLVTDTVPA